MKTIYPILFFLIACAFGTNAQVVINEVYGGGGNSGAIYNRDFIELYNNGPTDVSLAGYSVQYAGSTGFNWSKTDLSGTIKSKGYFLIGGASGSNGVALPTVDVSGTLNLSGSKGKIILFNSGITVTSGISCPTTDVVDKVGFGTGTDCFEGTGPTALLTNATSAQRISEGVDNNDNRTDFQLGTPTPINSSSVADVTAPQVSSYSPTNAAIDVATGFTASITFDEPVKKGATGNILLKQTSDNSTVQTIDLTLIKVSGSSISFPINGLTPNTSYYFTIDAGAIKDLAGNDFAGISDNTTWTFTTTATLPVGTIGVTYDLEQCISSLPDGFSSFSVFGSAVWGCTTFGRNPSDPMASAGNAVQINGYSNGSNQVNKDWFISPSFDLTATDFPLLSFWSRNSFNGDQLQLKVSTDYPGFGDPTAYSWTDLNGKFPNQASNIWTLSNNINLTAFKSANTYFAFVYTSTIDDGARWTVDDIRVDNSSTPPPASLSVNLDEVRFGYVPSQTSAVKDFSFTANDITSDVTLTVGGNFLISKTNNNFTSTITYTMAEANNNTLKVFVQFAPAKDKTSYENNIVIRTTGVSDTSIKVTGNSINSEITLEVVNWNLEWFGTSEPGYGPTNKILQASNVKKIAVNVAADLYGFVEVVSEARLQGVVDTLNSVYGSGAYDYVLCDYGSHTNPFDPIKLPLANAQKEAFVYKTSVISNVSTSALVTEGVNTAADLNNPAYDWFSSGRYPYMMKADVTLGGVTQVVRFVLIHAKANTNPTNISYERRKNGADALHSELNTLYPDDKIVLLGDFNDDLDFSITSGYTTSSYEIFNKDTAGFYSPTLALSLEGKRSTVGFNDMIDHVELSNEMKVYYMKNSATVLTDVAALIPNYASTTSDHYPIFTRYAFDRRVLPVVLVSFTATKQHSDVVLDWTTSQEVNSKSFVIEKSADAKSWTELSVINAKGNNPNGNAYTTTDYTPFTGVNYYRLKQIDQDGTIQYSLIRSVVFEIVNTMRIVPNPASNMVTVEFSKNDDGVTYIDVYDVSGKLIHQESTSNRSIKMNVSNYKKGAYIIQIKQGNKMNNQRLIVQ